MFLFVCRLGDHLLVSGPEGPFSLRPLRDVTHLYLLAAGTGFTPMARLIQFALQDLGSIKYGLVNGPSPQRFLVYINMMIILTAHSLPQEHQASPFQPAGEGHLLAQ